MIHATLWWPFAAYLAMRFRDLGCRVQSICPPKHPLRFVRGIEPCNFIRSWSVQQSLIDAIEKSHADYIVPTDDRALWQLHALAASHPQYRELVVRSLGDLKSFDVVRSRASLLALADSLQILTPRTAPLSSKQEAAGYANSWSYPAVVKRDGTYGGLGVAVVKTPHELVEVYGRLQRKVSVLPSLKRRLIDDDVLAFFRPGSLLPQGICLQNFVAGTPANAMYACFRGKLLATIQVRTVFAQNAKGSAVIVERINDKRIEDAGRKLAQALSLSGFFGLDFLLEYGSGRPYLLEMNPRATQLGHLPLEDTSEYGTLAEALWCGWADKTPSQPAPAGRPAKLPRRIALYPKALSLAPDSPLLASAWLDRPEGEPDLVRELSKMSWPERSLIYRLFHRFYGTQPEDPTVFPDAEGSM
jgi:glutathione synthase/RimK-type ligase-like ATP-grasp enzyme